MIRCIEPYVAYGYPSRRTIKNLLYKRGFVKMDKQRIPITNNEIIETGLGKYGIKCVEDLLNEIYNFGPHFKEANNYLWPFKLNSPRGGYNKKRHQYLNRGTHGPREQFINKLIDRML